MNFIDYLCSDAGVRISNFGIEGETYTLVDGEPTFTDKILNYPSGSSDGLRLNVACVLQYRMKRNTGMRNLNQKRIRNGIESGQNRQNSIIRSGL